MQDAPQDSGKQEIDWRTAVDWKLVSGLVDDYWREVLSLPPGGDADIVRARFGERIEQITGLMTSAEQRRIFNVAIKAARDSVVEEAKNDPHGLHERLGLTTAPPHVDFEPEPEPPPQIDFNRAKRLVDDYWRELLSLTGADAIAKCGHWFEQRLAQTISELPAAEQQGFANAVDANREALIQAHELDPLTVRLRFGAPLLPHHKRQLAARQRQGTGATIAKDVGRTVVRFTVWEMLLRLFGR
jgi:hypothetical protein